MAGCFKQRDSREEGNGVVKPRCLELGIGVMGLENVTKESHMGASEKYSIHGIGVAMWVFILLFGVCKCNVYYFAYVIFFI